MAEYKAPWGSYDSTDLYRLAQLGYGEARGESDTGLAATMHVAMNRMNDKRFPDSIKDVALQRKQFSAFDDQYGKIASAPQKDPQGWTRAVQMAKAVLDGNVPDPTNGATHYYAPQGMPGGAAPRWAASQSAQGAPIKIGNQIFMGKVMPAAADGAKTAPTPVSSTIPATAAPAPAAPPMTAPSPLSSPGLFAQALQAAKGAPITLPSTGGASPPPGSFGTPNLPGPVPVLPTSPVTGTQNPATSLPVPATGQGVGGASGGLVPAASPPTPAPGPVAPSMTMPLPPPRDPAQMSITPSAGQFDPNGWAKVPAATLGPGEADTRYDSVVADLQKGGGSTLDNLAKLLGLG